MTGAAPELGVGRKTREETEMYDDLKMQALVAGLIAAVLTNGAPSDEAVKASGKVLDFINEIRKDAERYRFLKASDEIHYYTWLHDHSVRLRPEVDELIDDDIEENSEPRA